MTGAGGRSVTGFFYANAAWQDKVQLTDPHAVFQYWTAPYTRTNLGFGLKTDDERYALSVWVKNLFDNRPFTAWAPGNATTPATIGWPNDPRAFGGGTMLVEL